MMTPDNIGISIGPTLLLSPKIRNDPTAFMSNKAPAILAYCIDRCEEIFYGAPVTTATTLATGVKQKCGR